VGQATLIAPSNQLRLVASVRPSRHKPTLATYCTRSVHLDPAQSSNEERRDTTSTIFVSAHIHHAVVLRAADAAVVHKKRCASMLVSMTAVLQTLYILPTGLQNVLAVNAATMV
jgi:hypothetical protein